jgi:uncharacterized protein
MISTAEQLRTQFKQLSNDLGISILPPERVTQTFGSTYVYLEKYDTAQAFLQMNIDNYPNSSSAYANMGQYWQSRGNKKKALEYYEKSVKIFPENEDSLNNIENLKKDLRE